MDALQARMRDLDLVGGEAGLADARDVHARRLGARQALLLRVRTAEGRLVCAGEVKGDRDK